MKGIEALSAEDIIGVEKRKVFTLAELGLHKSKEETEKE